MFFEKKIQSSIDKYHVEIRVDRNVGKYHVLLFKDPPLRYVFGVPVRKEPLLGRYFDLEVPYTKAVTELINEWELPIRHGFELEAWDGTIKEEEPQAMTEPQQPTEKERIITVSDHTGEMTYIKIDGEDWIMPVDELEKDRIIPVTDHQGGLEYIRLSKRKKRKKEPV